LIHSTGLEQCRATIICEFLALFGGEISFIKFRFSLSSFCFYFFFIHFPSSDNDREAAHSPDTAITSAFQIQNVFSCVLTNHQHFNNSKIKFSISSSTSKQRTPPPQFSSSSSYRYNSRNDSPPPKRSRYQRERSHSYEKNGSGGGRPRRRSSPATTDISRKNHVSAENARTRKDSVKQTLLSMPLSFCSPAKTGAVKGLGRLQSACSHDRG
jgi:hypothetical protein